MKKNGLILLVLLFGLLAGCTQSQANLAGTQWQVGMINGTPAISGVDPTLNFGKDSTLSGWDGCNNFTGTYTVNGNSLSITPGASTMMACPDNIMTQASAFTAALAKVASFRMDKANLTMKDSGGADILEFLVVVPTAITSGTWNAVNVNNGNQAVVGLVEGSSITAVFGTDGSLSGNGGCNNYNASYKVDGNKITIGQVASTMMACAEDVMAQESQYFTALGKSTVFSIQNGQLEFRDGSDAMQVLFNLK